MQKKGDTVFPFVLLRKLWHVEVGRSRIIAAVHKGATKKVELHDKA